MSEENLRVAVRVRPFNQREKDANSKLVVSMSGNQTILINPKTKEEKKFAYDYSYWSHDGFKTESNGYMSPSSSKYADQKKVYSDLGAGVLKNAWGGYNSTLFAYGQTGSGKSYSVVGYGENKGIVPIICEEIFKGEADAKKSGKVVEVTFSMLEIYSENVRDLLSKGKTPLTVREDPKLGFYAQGQQKILVDEYADIAKLMDEGNANRTIAATNMNATSSRAHTIVAISLVQKYKNEGGKEMAKSSVMNLVDLAGSERADQTGATGDRLKEGAAINLSLTALGSVISALADNSQGKNVRVPYRDSQLTKLLMNALGGNSKTIMIAAISPADINFDESMSTLRYADRAKQIKTKAVVNEDPTEKLINDLKTENARLKKLLEDSKVDPNLAKAGGAAGGAAAGAAGGEALAAHLKEEEALKKQLEENEKSMKAMAQSYEEKLAAAKANTANFEASKQLEKAKTVPHLRNINMDPSLCGTVKILLEGEGTKIIGLPGKAEIGIKGFGILEKHAAITIKGGKFSIERFGDARVLRNGKLLTTPSELVHLDRLVFGTSQYFVFQDPSKVAPNQPYYDFEAMQDEIGRESGIVNKDNNQNMSQDEIKCQNELLDLLPAIEEANQISITLDKKVMFKAIAVSGETRGEYGGKFKAFVQVKNLALNCEWLWSKDKFIARKTDITEMLDDLKDDGKINREKFKKYDPFFEDPEKSAQIGTAMIFPKSFAYLLSTKSDFKVINFQNQEIGYLDAEILPCTKEGKVITQQDGIVINDPKKDLLNKNVSFIIKINGVKKLPMNFYDVYCQFNIFDDPTIYTSEVSKDDNSDKVIDIKFNKQLSFTATPEFLDKIMSKCLFVQIYAKQKYNKNDPSFGKTTTKEYFDRIFGMVEHLVIGKDGLNYSVDPEVQKLHDDLNIANAQNNRNKFVIQNVSRITQIAGSTPIPPDTIRRLLNSRSEQDANDIINDFAKKNKLENQTHKDSQEVTSKACIIQ